MGEGDFQQLVALLQQVLFQVDSLQPLSHLQPCSMHEHKGISLHGY